MPDLRVISLGAGVQSSTVYLLAAEGRLGDIDAAIFADTGWEPKKVYEHLDRLQKFGGGPPIHRVSAGNIRDTTRRKDFYDVPYFLLHPDGSGGMARRQCTHELKIRPIRRKLNELIAERGIKKRPGCVESLMGISVDEYRRVKDSDVQWATNAYPLIDLGWSRADCKNYLDQLGWSAPRSACIGCPFHSDAEWRDLKRNAPEEFADAAAFELEVQQRKAGLRGKPFLHASRIPLGLVDLANAEDRGQLNFDDECAGVCGV
jgi:hypothetical protein